MLWPVTVAIPVAALAVADVSTGIDPATLVGQISSGVGLLSFAWLWLTGRIVSRPEYERVIADRDRERQQKDDLQKIVIEQVIPAVTRTTDVLQIIAPQIQPQVILRREGDEGRS